MQFRFDFQMHTTPSTLKGTQYFEFVPGPYDGRHWQLGAVFVDEYTFSLFEGIFERRVADYDHFSLMEIDASTWRLIVEDLQSLREVLTSDQSEQGVNLPFSSSLKVEDYSSANRKQNRHELALLLVQLVQWLEQTLIRQPVISLLGL